MEANFGFLPIFIVQEFDKQPNVHGGNANSKAEEGSIIGKEGERERATLTLYVQMNRISRLIDRQ